MFVVCICMYVLIYLCTHVPISAGHTFYLTIFKFETNICLSSLSMHMKFYAVIIHNLYLVVIFALSHLYQ